MAAKKRADPREAEYLACEDATDLWAQIRNETGFKRRAPAKPPSGDRYNRRLLYLMAAAVFRSVQKLVPHRRWRKMLDTIEAYADGEATFRELESAWEARYGRGDLTAAGQAVADCADLLLDDYKVLEGVDYVSDAMGYVGAVKAGVLDANARLGAGPGAGRSVWAEPSFQEAKKAHERALCGIIRDIFGNPYRPTPAIDPAWLAWEGGEIPNLARTMYAGKRFKAMPILGDALEEAGCSDEALLSHCRGKGPHVRGCWVVDLALGKS